MAIYQSIHTGLEIDQAVSAVSGLTSTVSGHTTQINELEQDIVYLSGATSGNTQSIINLTQDLSNLNNTVTGHTSQISNIKNTIVTGATSSTDNAIARFDGTTGKLIQNSGIIVDDSGYMGFGTTPTAQITQTSTVDLESAPLGAELLTSSGWGSTNWTGDFAAGFTHTTGNVTPLTNTLAALNATLYQISYTITNRTAGSINITFGGRSTGAVTSSGSIGNKTESTGTLNIAPTTDFNGTIVVSIKRITGTYAPTYQILDSTGISNIEIRSSLNTLNNTFIGKGAGRYNTTGSNNSAQGFYALYSNTTGSRNSAQGSQALLNNTTGSANSAQGVYALFSNTTGSNNSAQGFYAGRYLADGVTGNQTSNNSIFLGYNTKSKQAGQTNEIVIGNNAIGNGSNTVTLGHTDITDTYLRGRVHTNSSIQIGDDTSVASAANEFAIRGRKGVNGNIGFSVVEMSMQTDVNTWTWVEVVRNEWIIP